MERVIDTREQAPAKRRSRQELRELLLAAGRDQLIDDGLFVGVGALSFKKVFDKLEQTTGIRVTNASVIRRVWENQAEFQLDVLMAVAEGADHSGEVDATLDALAPTLLTMDLSTPAGRQRALDVACRVGSEASIRTRMETRAWSLWLGVWVLAVTGSPSEGRDLLRDALVRGLDDVADLWDQVYAGLLQRLGFRVREPYTLHQFTVATAVLVEGSALSQVGSGSIERISLPTGPDGQLEEWTPFGIALHALNGQFLELDPSWVPPAVLPGP